MNIPEAEFMIPAVFVSSSIIGGILLPYHPIGWVFIGFGWGLMVLQTLSKIG